MRARRRSQRRVEPSRSEHSLRSRLGLMPSAVGGRRRRVLRASSSRDAMLSAALLRAGRRNASGDAVRLQTRRLSIANSRGIGRRELIDLHGAPGLVREGGRWSRRWRDKCAKVFLLLEISCDGGACPTEVCAAALRQSWVLCTTLYRYKPHL